MSSGKVTMITNSFILKSGWSHRKTAKVSPVTTAAGSQYSYGGPSTPVAEPGHCMTEVGKQSTSTFVACLSAKMVGSSLGILFSVPKPFTKVVSQMLPNPMLVFQCQDPEVSPKLYVIKHRLEFEDSKNASNDTFTSRLPPRQDQSTSDRQCSITVFIEWSSSVQSHLKLDSDVFSKNLYSREESKDITIIPGIGREVKCHRVILEAHSDVLATMLSHNNGMLESQTGKINMPANSEEGITLLVRYLYGLGINVEEVSCPASLELFRMADQYNLPELENALMEMLRQKDINWFTSDGLLEIYFHAKNLKRLNKVEEGSLLNKMLKVSRSRIRSCQRFKELPKSVAADLLSELLDLEKKNRIYEPVCKRTRLATANVELITLD